jgi:hypothetical protein
MHNLIIRSETQHVDLTALLDPTLFCDKAHAPVPKGLSTVPPRRAPCGGGDDLMHNLVIHYETKHVDLAGLLDLPLLGD